MSSRRPATRVCALALAVAATSSCGSDSTPPPAAPLPVPSLSQVLWLDSELTELDQGPDGRYRYRALLQFSFPEQYEIVVRPFVSTYGAAGDSAKNNLDQTLFLPEMRFESGTTVGEVVAEFDICGIARDHCWTYDIRVDLVFVVGGWELRGEEGGGMIAHPGNWSNRDCSSLTGPPDPIGSFC